MNKLAKLIKNGLLLTGIFVISSLTTYAGDIDVSISVIPVQTVGTNASSFNIWLTIQNAADFTDGESFSFILPDNMPEAAATTADDGKLSISSLRLNGVLIDEPTDNVTTSANGRTFTFTIDDVDNIHGNGTALQNGDTFLTGVWSNSDTAGTAGPLYTGVTSLDENYFSTTSDATLDVIDANLTVVAGALTSASVTYDSDIASSSGPHTYAFTTTTEIPTGGKIELTYPAGWNVSGANGQVATNLSGMSGTWTASVSGQTITLTESGAGQTAAGALGFTLSGIQTPSGAGSGGNLSATTQIASGSADVDTLNTISLGTIVSGSGSSAVIPDAPTALTATVNSDNQVVLNWEDPDLSSSIQIIRSKGEGSAPSSLVGLASPKVETYTDTDVTAGETINYAVRALSTDGEYSTMSETVTLTLQVASETVTSNAEQTEVIEQEPEVVQEPEVIEEEPEVVEEPEEVPEFSDTKGHWGKAAIEAMAKYQVVTGDPDGKFRPNDGLNRAEGAAMIYRIFSADEPSEPSIKPFSDTELGSWFVKYLSALKGEGLVNGNPDGTFKPSSAMNRAEFLTLAVNLYLEINGLEMEVAEITAAFADLEGDAWYLETVTYAYNNGFVGGIDCGDDKCFNAEAGVTRAEAAAILDNIFGEMLGEE